MRFLEWISSVWIVYSLRIKVIYIPTHPPNITHNKKEAFVSYTSYQSYLIFGIVNSRNSTTRLSFTPHQVATTKLRHYSFLTFSIVSFENFYIFIILKFTISSQSIFRQHKSQKLFSDFQLSNFTSKSRNIISLTPFQLFHFLSLKFQVFLSVLLFPQENSCFQNETLTCKVLSWFHSSFPPNTPERIWIPHHIL